MICVYDKHTPQGGFDNCGLRILNPVSAYIHEELNGLYSYEVSCPMVSDDDSWHFLKPYNILKSSTGQLFAIYKTVTATSGGVPTITAYANHIWYYLADMCVVNAGDFRELYWTMSDLFWPCERNQYREQPFTGGPTLFSGGAGLTSYDFWEGGRNFKTDIGGFRRYKFKKCSLAYAILGAPDSVVNLWGGYIHRDNFKFSIMQRKEGTDDNAFELIYGLNCTEVKHTKDYSKSITEHWGWDQFGHRAGISVEPDAGTFPHQVITAAEYSVDEMWENRLEDNDGISQYVERHFWDNVGPADTYEVNYVDMHKTSSDDTGWDALRYLKVGDSGYVTSLDGDRQKHSIISVKYNDITERIDSLKLGKFIHSDLHETRWDKIIADDANASRRLDILEKRMNYFEFVKGEQ